VSVYATLLLVVCNTIFFFFLTFSLGGTCEIHYGIEHHGSHEQDTHHEQALGDSFVRQPWVTVGRLPGARTISGDLLQPFLGGYLQKSRGDSVTQHGKDSGVLCDAAEVTNPQGCNSLG
jgi:hypothetical protein